MPQLLCHANVKRRSKQSWSSRRACRERNRRAADTREPAWAQYTSSLFTVNTVPASKRFPCTPDQHDLPRLVTALVRMARASVDDDYGCCLGWIDGEPDLIARDLRVRLLEQVLAVGPGQIDAIGIRVAITCASMGPT
jgi:hypothetical protein